MKLSSRARYAVTAMLDVAVHAHARPVCLNEIAERQDLSRAYLEQLFSGLRRHGLVESTRGPGGGYRLGRQPEQISVADVIRAVDEHIDATGCRGSETPQCVTYELWEELNEHVEGFLAEVHLDTLRRKAEQERARGIDCACESRERNPQTEFAN